MAKDQGRNGTLKIILAIVALVGLCLTILGIAWKASGQTSKFESRLESNCSEDARVHPKAEANEKTIIEVKKDIEQISKDMNRFADAVETIEKQQRQILGRLPER